MKNIIKSVIVLALLSSPVAYNAHADLVWGALNFLGTPGKVVNFVFSQYVGDTTVTPSWDIYTWDYGSRMWESDWSTNVRKKYRYDLVTKRGRFLSASWSVNPFYSSTSTEPFDTGGVAISMYNCSSSGAGQSSAQTYTFAATCSTTSTGVNPPSGPFEVTLKTIGTRQVEKCEQEVNYHREFRRTIHLMPYGYVTERLGTASYAMDFPFQCWAGTPYKY